MCKHTTEQSPLPYFPLWMICEVVAAPSTLPKTGCTLSMNIYLYCYPTRVAGSVGGRKLTARELETRKFDKNNFSRTSGPQQTEARQPGSSNFRPVSTYLTDLLNVCSLWNHDKMAILRQLFTGDESFFGRQSAVLVSSRNSIP